MTEKEKMLAGAYYDAQDPQLVRERERARAVLRAFLLSPDPGAVLPRSFFGRVGRRFWIEAPFHCDYGTNIHLGENFYANAGCVILDVCRVTIGRDCLLGPQVNIYTAAHPLDPALRRSGLEYGQPVVIGDNVWLGGRVVVNPGVTIGDNTVVASGAVVAKSLPADVVAGGNPARILKEL